MDLKRVTSTWKDYQLVDSGEFEKLERFGPALLVRPEPLALWLKADPEEWSQVSAVYSRSGEEGNWQTNKPLPQNWIVSWQDLRFTLRTTSFKHIGIFPEQAANWEWIRTVVKPGMKVLNLFGYTGGATLAAASVGGEVVHVDSSKPAVTWAKLNADVSGLADKPVRWIEDDAQKFVEREIRRGNIYQAVFLDPPAFGRGPKGELWKFEEDLPLLLDGIKQILEPGGLLLLNTYSLGLPAMSIEQMVKSYWPEAKTEAVELCLEESSQRKFNLPTGIAIRARV